MKVSGLDYLFPRNLIEAFVPMLLAIGAGLAAVRVGPAIAAALALAGIALVIQVSVNPRVQRDDWRGAVRALGPAAAPRVLVVTPEVGRTPIEFYAPQTVRLQRAGAPVTEIAVVANARPPRFVPRPPPPGFRLASTRRAASWEVVRYMSSTARPIGPNRARAVRLDLQAAAATLIQRGGG